MANSATYLTFGVLTLAIFAGVCDAQAGEKCQPDLITPVFNFTVEKDLGTWYAYAFYARVAEEMYELDFACLEEDTRVSDSETIPLVIEEKFRNLTTGEEVTGMFNYVMYDEEKPAVWKVFGFRGDVILEHNIIYVQTDYDNWAIQYGCTERNNYRFQDMTVWTRERNPDPAMMEVIEGLVSNHGFPVENAMRVDQTNC